MSVFNIDRSLCRAIRASLPRKQKSSIKAILFANTDWYLYNFRLALAREMVRRGAEVVMVSPPGQYGPLLENEGFRWIPVDLKRRSLNPLEELRVIRSLARLYQVEQPDLVHNFTIKPVVYGSLAAICSGVPAVVNAVAGLGYIFSSNALLARMLRPFVWTFLKLVLNMRSSRIIVQNPDDENFFVRARLVDVRKVRLIKGSGVDTERFRPHEVVPKQEVTVVLATRLLWVKGVKEFVEAASFLKDAKVPVRFLVAGVADEGNPDAIPPGQIEQWSHEGKIIALGHIDDMAALLEEVDIVVLPTLYGEGVPRILLEAASAGLPVIATSVPGCREIVEHGVTGLLVSPQNSRELAEAIMYLTGRPDVRRAMGMQGRRKVIEEFDEKIVIRKTIDVYKELLPEFCSPK